MSRLLPLSRRDRLRSGKQVHRRDLKTPGVSPEIYVRIKDRPLYLGGEYAKARIRTRSGGYRFLIWWQDGRQKEFYLGKVKTYTLDRRRRQLAGAGRGRQLEIERNKGKNSSRLTAKTARGSKPAVRVSPGR